MSTHFKLINLCLDRSLQSSSKTDKLSINFHSVFSIWPYKEISTQVGVLFFYLFIDDICADWPSLASSWFEWGPAKDILAK